MVLVAVHQVAVGKQVAEKRAVGKCPMAVELWKTRARSVGLRSLAATGSPDRYWVLVCFDPSNDRLIAADLNRSVGLADDWGHCFQKFHC